MIDSNKTLLEEHQRKSKLCIETIRTLDRAVNMMLVLQKTSQDIRMMVEAKCPLSQFPYLTIGKVKELYHKRRFELLEIQKRLEGMIKTEISIHPLPFLRDVIDNAVSNLNQANTELAAALKSWRELYPIEV